MAKIIVIYGSSTGACEGFANQIAAKLDAEAVEVSTVTTEQLEEADVLVLGSSTWGLGELQDDWYDGVNTLKEANLNGKKVALFGCGDASSYPDTFCDAIGLIYQEIENAGCEFVGAVSTDGYSFDSSVSVVDGNFIGLALDDVNDGDLNDERIENWVAQIKPLF